MKMLKLALKIGLGALLAGIVLVVVINLWVANSSNGSIFEAVDEVPPAPVALLLGTSKNVGNGRINPFYKHRMDAAAQLYHAGKVRKIIVSGDNGSRSYDETTDMRRSLIAAGVPDKDIVEDFAGFRTLDSVVRAKNVFGQDKIVVVSQRFHVQRALFIARAHGIEASGFVAEDPAHKASFQKVMYREYLARVKAFLDCYILGTEPKFPGPPEPIRFGES